MATQDSNLGPNSSASTTENASVDSSAGSYLIKKGDNLTKIAKNNGTSIDAILKLNPQITNRDLIYAGSNLTLPAPPTSTVTETQTDLSNVKTDDGNGQTTMAPAAVDNNKAQEASPDNEDIEGYANGGAAGASQAENDAINKALGGGLGSKPMSITGSSSGSPATQVSGKTITPFLRDYQHASKLFRGGQLPDGQQGLMPKNGFLFHVVFDLAPNITRAVSLVELGMLVKAITLPKFTVEMKQQNAYNRVNYTQTKIKYDPVSISFHDDSANVVRDFWFSYFNYYYRDSDYSESLYQIKHKYNERSAVDWGYSPKNSTNSEFLNSIRIFSLHQKNFSEYVLVNPIIKSFKHGDHKYDESNTLMSHDMVVEYETVLYYSGTISEDTVKGFGTIRYDKTPSPNLGKEENLMGPGSATDRTNKGSNRLSSDKPDGSKQPLENPKNNPPAKDWITSAGDSIFGKDSFISNKIFVPIAKSIAHNATSKVTTAINKTVGQSIAKVQGALGPTIGGIVVPAVTEGFGGIPNIGSYVVNKGSNILSNASNKTPIVDQSINQSNNTPNQIAFSSTVSEFSITDQNVTQIIPMTNMTNLTNMATALNITDQGLPGANLTDTENLQVSSIDNRIKMLTKSMSDAQTQLDKYQPQLSMALENIKFFNKKMNEKISNGSSASSPVIKKLQSYLDQQIEIKAFAEQQVSEADQQLISLKKSKQLLVKELVKK